MFSHWIATLKMFKCWLTVSQGIAKWGPWSITNTVLWFTGNDIFNNYQISTFQRLKAQQTLVLIFVLKSTLNVVLFELFQMFVEIAVRWVSNICWIKIRWVGRNWAWSSRRSDRVPLLLERCIPKPDRKNVKIQYNTTQTQMVSK